MRVVLATNVLLSALIAPGSTSDALNGAGRERRFQHAFCERQFEEFGRVTTVSIETQGIAEAIHKAAR